MPAPPRPAPRPACGWPSQAAPPGWGWRWSGNCSPEAPRWRSSPAGRERVERVAREHAGAHGIVGDVSLKDEIYPIAMQIVGELGGLDVLINNASDLGPTPLALLGDTECEDLERALATNVLGPFRLTKALARRAGSRRRARAGAPWC